MDKSPLNPGSLWRRWEPHIHSPDTVLNDQFNGENAWEEFIDAIEATEPAIEALGLTDYCVLSNYQRTVSTKEAGRLPNVKLIFPNIELRLAIATERANPINFHLLISPDDPHHVAEAERFLGRLEFRMPGDKFLCRQTDLIRLGRSHAESIVSDTAALRIGVTQFKVDIDQFLEEWEASKWIQSNALIAVAASRSDGTSGLQKDASFAATRQKIERIAHVIFSANPGDRAFWLGKSKLSPEKIMEYFGSLKPCLHGSDAHKLKDVGAPAKDRYSWVKGDPTFEALRQACMEPEHRTMIGPFPPSGPSTSQVIRSVSVSDAPWFTSSLIPLNPGLVGIIGARGSGKTALADMIAAGAHSLSEHLDERSFVKRASRFFSDEVARLVWDDEEETECCLSDIGIQEGTARPHVQYLSQKFVEALCSSEGATEALVSEIEEVIFAAHPPEARQGSTNFEELRDARAALARQKRSTHERSIHQIGEMIARERDKRDGLPALKANLKQLRIQLKRDERAKSALVTKDGKARSKALDKVSKAVDAVRQKIGLLEKRKNSLRLLDAHVLERRSRLAGQEMQALSAEYRDANLSRPEWEMFLTDFVGDVDKLIKSKLREVDKAIRALQGSPVPRPFVQQDDGSLTPYQESILPEGKAVKSVPLKTLQAEANRLEALVGIDERKLDQFKKLTKRITKTGAELSKIKAKIKDADKAKDRIRDFVEQRNSDYARVCEGIVAEEDALRELYQPLSSQLAAEEGSLARISVSIKRHVDIAEWAQQGESLLDLRRAGGFRGRGALLHAVREELQIPWECATAEELANVMASFRNRYRKKFVNSAPYDPETNLRGYRQWSKEISEWIYSTDHIQVTYSLQFDGVDIERLSPGTRGIVLLLLYLAVDQEDDRPLIIDQPEENLDPKSIFDELVGRFRQNKARRQVIMVTHNANLIVNADADQVIVASCTPQSPDELPSISYQSGSLEDPIIRQHVCDILEGGEHALRERAKRLRVDLRNH
ncbi:MAG: AAA family ATPase [Albidovulum sp.]|nr:AAA family ATPase [Albidovulum sp.]